MRVVFFLCLALGKANESGERREIKLWNHLLENDCVSLYQQLRIQLSKTNTQTPGGIMQTITF